MKLEELLGERNLRATVEELLLPDTVRPPKAKGSDAIKVTGYIVHGHWRRRWYPPPRLMSKNGHKKRYGPE